MGIESVYTLSEFIIEGKQNKYINSEYCKYIQLGESIVTIGGNMIDVYLDFLSALKVKVALTSDEFLKYKHNPKLLCKKLYGTEEITPLLLRLNNMSHECDFERKKIFVFNPDGFSDIMNKIISLNEDKVKNNNAEF